MAVGGGFPRKKNSRQRPIVYTSTFTSSCKFLRVSGDDSVSCTLATHGN